MKKLLTQVTKIIKALNKNALNFSSEDKFDGDNSFVTHDIAGHSIIINDDNDKQCIVNLDHISVNDSTYVTHEALTTILCTVLGPQTKIAHSSLYSINIWTPPCKNIFIRHYEHSIEIVQTYTKR